MSPRLQHLLIPLTLGLLLLPAGCRRQQEPDADTAHKASVSVDATTQIDAELAAILADPTEINRLHKLSLWVQSHSPEEVARVIHAGTPAQSGELTWLLQLKLTELFPGEDEQALNKRLFQLLQTDHAPPGQTPDLATQLLTLARQSPSAAFERVASARIHPNKRSQIACDILRQVATDSPERALALLKITPGDHRDGLIAIAQAWASKDPRAALAWVNSLPPSDYNTGLSDQLLGTWSRQDPAGVVEYISKLPVTADNRYDFTQAIGNWLRESPDESAKWIAAQTTLDPLVLTAALDTLGSTHPQLVARLLTQPMASNAFERYSNQLAASWAATDPAAARAWIESQPLSQNTLRMMKAYCSVIARTDQAAAIAYYQSLPADAYTGDVVADIANNFDSPQKALAWLLQQPDTAGSRSAIANNIGRMEFKNAPDMLRMLNQLPPGPRQLPLYKATAERWFSEDPAAAAKWAGNLQDPDVLETVLNSGMQTWANTDPTSLGALLETIGKEPRFAKTANDFVNTLAERDPLAAGDWITRNPDVKISDYRVRQVFASIANYAPESIAAKLTAIPEGKQHQQALAGVLSAVVKTDPEKAARLFTDNAALKERKELISYVTGSWSKTDPNAAIDWIATQPASSTRDQGVRQIIYNIAQADPQRALSLADIASSPAAREDLLSNAIYAWHTHDSAAALTALDQINISPERREKIRKQLASR